MRGKKKVVVLAVLIVLFSASVAFASLALSWQSPAIKPYDGERPHFLEEGIHFHTTLSVGQVQPSFEASQIMSYKTWRKIYTSA